MKTEDTDYRQKTSESSSAAVPPCVGTSTAMQNAAIKLGFDDDVSAAQTPVKRSHEEVYDSDLDDGDGYRAKQFKLQ